MKRIFLNTSYYSSLATFLIENIVRNSDPKIRVTFQHLLNSHFRIDHNICIAFNMAFPKFAKNASIVAILSSFYEIIYFPFFLLSLKHLEYLA